MPGESAKAAAIREAQEEVGIMLEEKNLSITKEENRGSHKLVLFFTKLDSLPKIKTAGDEGEEIKIFSPKEVLSMRDFFPNHRGAFEKILKTSKMS